MKLALTELRRRPGRFSVAAVILTLIAILLSGLFLLKKFGNVPVFRVGLILVIVLFPGIILAVAVQRHENVTTGVQQSA